MRFAPTTNVRYTTEPFSHVEDAPDVALVLFFPSNELIVLLKMSLHVCGPLSLKPIISSCEQDVMASKLKVMITPNIYNKVFGAAGVVSFDVKNPYESLTGCRMRQKNAPRAEELRAGHAFAEKGVTS